MMCVLSVGLPTLVSALRSFILILPLPLLRVSFRRYASLCSTSLTAIVWVALLQLAAGVCAVPMVVCNVLLLLRLGRQKEKRRGDGGGGDDGDMDYDGDVAIMPMGKGHMGTKFPTREALMEAVTGGKGGPVMA